MLSFVSSRADRCRCPSQVRDSWVEENPHLAARLAANPRIGQRFAQSLEPNVYHAVKAHMDTPAKPGAKPTRDRSEFFNDLRPGAH